MSEVNENAAPEAGEALPVPAPSPSAPRPDERPKRHHVAPALITLERVIDDPQFQLRDAGDVSNLAMDIARLGQLFPVDLRLRPPDKFQVITGFRRVAALRFLQRDKVLARLHTDLSDDDALLMALAEAIHAAPVTKETLQKLRDRLEAEGKLQPAAREMLARALSPDDGLAPENYEEEGEKPAPSSSASASEEEAGAEEEVDADELASDVTVRLSDVNQDLSLLADVFADLDKERQDKLLEQLRYSSDLVAYLEGLK